MAGVPCQEFVNHSDMAGGSTLGNILLSQMEMRGVDIGNPMWAMHPFGNGRGFGPCLRDKSFHHVL